MSRPMETTNGREYTRISWSHAKLIARCWLGSFFRLQILVVRICQAYGGIVPESGCWMLPPSPRRRRDRLVRRRFKIGSSWITVRGQVWVRFFILHFYWRKAGVAQWP